MKKIAEVLAQVMELDPMARAVEYAPDQWWTFGDLASLVSGLITCFADAQLPEGAAVGVIFRNRPQQLGALLACTIDGKCAVALNPLLSIEALHADIRERRPAMLIGEESDLAASGLAELAHEIGSALVQLPGGHGKAAAVTGLEKPRMGDLETRPGVLIEMLTSGTTGPPKRVPLMARSFDMSFDAAASTLEGRNGDEGARLRTGVRILTAPLSHISGISAALMTLAAGRKLALMEKFEVAAFVAAIVRLRPKLVNAPPAALRMMLDAKIDPASLSSVKAIRTGTAPLDPVIADEFLARYDIPVLQTYGATEFAGAVAGWALGDFRDHWAAKRGSVGRLMSGVGARIVDGETGAEVASGGEGVLELTGAQLGPGNWVRTTDRAMIDEDGFLFIRGRTDGAIIRGGFKIHAEDVVRAIESHPSVREAAIVGLADRRLGEVPVCVFIPVAGAVPPKADELRAFLRERLLPYQIPVEFLMVDELPRTPSMKPSLPDVLTLFQRGSVTAGTVG
ncbi:class I adenylate-forming enzyme family protein [Sphingomonas sp. SRS2]|uniref:class I adenylate-forming enzyme family protein n=1 Tax=Sphingomonas sp. SRS2 TaxID=133190 RepID=UPI00061849A6|nr:fatty acid--CoA ligase family protein [Sphingomonas sp. SRS2]KKC24571.1 hypothetical protein WP12_18560 [Sphingomonas sp. SRS2]